MKSEIRVKRCSECANNCPLDDPKCITGQLTAKNGDIYEEVEKESRFRQWLKIEKYKFKR